MANVKKHISDLKRDILKEMLTLATSGFGLVAALAWNEVIKEFIDEFVKPIMGGASGIISLLIYAVIVTLLAVFVTYSLTKVIKRK